MNIPRFTADESVFKTSGHYRAISTFNAKGNGQVALPQSMALLKCLQGCHSAGSPDYCQQQCFWQEDIGGGSGGNGTGGGGGGQSCAPGCGPCQVDPDSTLGGTKTCVRHDCSTYDRSCKMRPMGRSTMTDGLLV